jgi:nucleotide-binding universal stress UspA family protein
MTVIIGIDEPAGSPASIRLAQREASLRGVKLLAVSTHPAEHTRSAPAARPPAGLRTAADGRGAAETLLRDAVTHALGDDSADVEVHVLPGLGGRGLVDIAIARQAELIVLAARSSMSHLVGAMTQYVLRHAPCPVLLVPESRPGAG